MPFSDGLAAVKIDGKWGYIDEAGRIAITPRFDGAGEFTEGLSTVIIGGKYGFIDKGGKVVIEPAFDVAWPFSCGLAMVEVDHRRGYIDRSGKIAIDLQFDMAFPFSEGLAYVTRNRRPTFIDTTGKEVLDFEVENAITPFSEGMTAVKTGGAWGFIDTRGKLVIAPQFGSVDNFSEGLAFVANRLRSHFFVDKTGKTVIPPRYGVGLGCEGTKFSEGLVAEWLDREGTCSLIDQTGKVVSRPEVPRSLTMIGKFSHGMAAFEPPGEKWGYLDRTGKVVIAPQFDWAGEFLMPDRSSSDACRVP